MTPVGTDLSELPVGGIVEAGPARDRAADRNIAAIAKDGFYEPRAHLARLQADPAPAGDAEALVEGYVRRLEALRRAGIVQRLSASVWRVPNDLVERGRAYDRARIGDVSAQLQAHMPVENQIRAVGATWLDRQLIEARTAPLGSRGFGVVVQQALQARMSFLVERGFAERHGSKVTLRRDLLNVLRQRELEQAYRSIAAETGLVARPVADGSSVSGVYRRSITLTSGRFAMLDDGIGFSLVPWRPVIDKNLGRTVSGVVRGEHVSWHLGRSRGIGRG